MEFAGAILIVIFSSIWDIPYRKMGIGDYYNNGEMDKVAWYRFMQHGGILLFAIIIGLLINWYAVLLGYLLNWSGLQDYLWYLWLEIPFEKKMYYMNWTPLGLINKYILKKWHDNGRFFISFDNFRFQIAIALVIAFILFLIVS